MGVSSLAMKFSSLVVLLLLVSLFSSSLGKKPSKQQKKNLKKFNKLAKKAEDYEKSLNALMTRLDAANKTASVSTRHAKGTDALTVVDATYLGSQCGPFTLSSWFPNINYYHATGGAIQTASPFSQGYFAPQVAGWYHICSFSRFKKGGNSNDVTVTVDGAVVAAYGSAVTSDWRTTGVCFDAELTTTNLVQVKHQSGGGSDCLESTSWPYNKFTVHNTAND